MTPAAQKLREIVDAPREWTRQRLAELLDCSEAHVSLILTGKRRPDPAKRVILREVFGIPIVEWLDEEERRVVQQAVEGHDES